MEAFHAVLSQLLVCDSLHHDPILHNLWFKKLANWRVDQLVFINESGINVKLGKPTHGYGKKGTRIQYKVNPHKAENISLLPALSIDGYIVCNTYEGSINGEMYEGFIHDFVLSNCKPWPGVHSVIIMDNASTHHGEVNAFHLKIF